MEDPRREEIRIIPSLGTFSVALFGSLQLDGEHTLGEPQR